MIDEYRMALQVLGTQPVSVYEASGDGKLPAGTGAMEKARQHVMWMLGNMPEEEGKFDRWLGFAQGVMWVAGMYGLNDLRRQVGKAMGETV